MDRRKYLMLIIIEIVFVLGCVHSAPASFSDDVKEDIVGTEDIGGKYNLTLIETRVTVNDTVYNMKKIRYVKDGEVVEPDMMLPPEMRDGLEWMSENTNEDAMVLSWWDYGHIIRAYAEREPVVDGPSKEILTTTVAKHIGKNPDDIECPDCVEHATIKDVAFALTAKDSSELIGIMDKYGASVFYAQRSDKFKSFAFYMAAGMEPEDPESDEFLCTITGRTSRGEDIEGLELVYSDENTRIYLLE